MHCVVVSLNIIIKWFILYVLQIWLSKCKSALSSELARMKIRNKVINDEELLEEKVQPIGEDIYISIGLYNI